MIGALGLGMQIISQFMTSSEKKEEAASDLIKTLVQTKTWRWVDALVKLSYASEQLVKGLLRPAFSAGLFVYAIANPDALVKLHELGTVGDAGIMTMFSAFPGWMYSRHKTKQVETQKGLPPDDDAYI